MRNARTDRCPVRLRCVLLQSTSAPSLRRYTLCRQSTEFALLELSQNPSDQSEACNQLFTRAERLFSSSRVSWLGSRSGGDDSRTLAVFLSQLPGGISLAVQIVELLFFLEC